MRRTLIAFTLLAAIILLAAAPQTPKLDPAEAARLNNLGVAYMNQQLFEKGLHAFEQSVAADPKFQTASLNRGIALLNLQRVDEAKQILEAASKQDPKDPHVWYNLGLLYKNSEGPQTAIDAFRRVTEIDPNDADTWYFLGTTYAQLKQFPQAIDAFQHALKIDPLHASAEFGLSRTLQQSGDTTQSREHLVKFQHITREKLGSPISLAYGEQGKYSRAEESPSVVEKVPAQIPVTLVDVTKEVGLNSRPASSHAQDLAAYFGPGACFIDYDNDGRIDVFLADDGSSGDLALHHNVGGKFEDVTKQANLDPAIHATSCTAGDYDNDGMTDLAVALTDRVLLLHNEKGTSFKDATQSSGIKAERANVGTLFIDYDHDGDLDLYITRTLKDASAPALGKPISLPSGLDFAANAMWRNNGNGTFTDVTNATALYADPSVNSIGSDYNNDRAVDLVVTDIKGPTVFVNPREGKFSTPGTGLGEFSRLPMGVAVLDFDHDGWMDIAFANGTTPDSVSALILARNDHGKLLRNVGLPATNWVCAFGVTAFDYDNDGWIDLVAVGETKDGKGEARLFRNLGPDGWKDVSTDVGLDKIELKNPRAIISGDYDNDGAVDLLITQNHGPAVLLRNEGGNKNNWLRLNLKGLNDNKSAIGTKVEVFSGANRQKFEIYGSSGYLGQNSPYLTVGLGQAKQADIVRMLWPTGVLQDEIEIPANKQQDFTEIDRRGSSCPTLFVWDGTHYELVGDLLGAGVVGHWVAAENGRVERNIPRPTEYIKVDRRMMQLKGGRYSFRLMEPMEEVVYLDQVRLLAVDHPAGVDVYPDERFSSNPPYPPFKVVTSNNPRPPAGAWDDHGHNLLPDLLAHKYVGDFEILPFKGFTKPHSLELDLGEAYNGGPLRLLLHGEIEYFTATGMYAADQAGLKPVAPYVEAQDAKGKWTRVVEDMGFPAGLPRTMTADLSGKLPAGTKRIRISTNLQIYWNSILIDRTTQNIPVRLTPVALETADLHFHGYPRQIENQPPGNVQYRYEEVSRTGPYARQAGTYTRYGDVKPLLTKYDDHFVVFGSGEGVALEFDPAKLPPLPKGWTRDYFFHAEGYEKDMDFYAAEGNTVEPLPFRAMGTYPYPGKQYPLDREHLNYLLEYNTRSMSGNEPSGYWYNYLDQKKKK
jgi:tetratricopeptide (TPR) repeat protein